jgi:hypothetical protein
MFPVDTSGVLLTSAPASTHRSRVKVPALQPKWLIRARQRLCSKVSRPSDVVKAGDRPPKYDNVHRTFRICQLTGASDPAGQPHPFDTTVVDLVGTDLGIPVDTGARLYFFFGDSPETDDSAGDGDPIAWTASGPEPNGPTLHWLVNEEGLYRRLTVEGIPTLENFEVPTGGFTYGGRIYLFIAREKVDGVMKTSHLAVSKLPHNDPNQNLQELYKVATCLDDGSNADWPGLPQSSGEGLLMFGSKNYMASNVYLAWAPLTPGQHPPHPSTWRYFKENHPGQWIAAATVPAGQEPTKLLIIPDPGPVAELSVIWQRRMRRWIMAHMQPGPNTAQAVVRTSRFPWGPWSAPVVVFDGVNDQLQAAADNLPGNKLVGHPHADATQNRNTVPYAPYLIARWSKFDPSTGRLTLYYTLSVEDPPYSPQLMRTHLICD